MNSRRFLTALLATSFIVPLGILPARGDDAAKAAFKSVKSGLQAKLRNRDDATRLEALDELRQYPTADAAKLVLGIMQTRQSDAVQQAAYQTLLSFKDEEDVGRLLLTTLQKGARRNAPTDITPLLLKIVLLSNHPDIEKKTLERIDAVANASGGSLPVMELADSLGASAEPDDAARLLKLTKLKAY
ncbi:MAG: hypothetical protein AB7U73_25155 [Pirellulales bacterium]